MRVVAAIPPETERHGLDLLRDTRLSGRALYAELIRLERTGLVESRWTASGRRGYRLTADGLAVAARHPATTAATTAASAPTATAWRSAWWLAVIAIAIGQSYAALARPIGDRLADLDVYVGAVTDLRHGASLYDFVSAAGGPFTYPPFAGLVLSPVALLPIGTLRLLWTCATLATVARVAALVGRALRPPWRTSAIMAVLLASAPVSSDLRFGQVSIGLALLVALDILSPPGLGPADRYRGALIGLAAAIKLTPLIFIPMLGCTGRRRPAAVAAATFAISVIAAGAVLPGDSWRFWTAEIWRVRRIGDLASTGNQSVTGALLRLGIQGSVHPILLLAATVMVGALALHRAGMLGREGDWLSAMVVVGTAGVALSPVSWTHHQVWTVLAAFLPVRGPAWAGRAWCATVLVVMILPVTSLGGPVWGNARLAVALAASCLVPLGRVVHASSTHQGMCSDGSQTLPI